jgi:hypothetical protein
MPKMLLAHVSGSVVNTSVTTTGTVLAVVALAILATLLGVRLLGRAFALQPHHPAHALSRTNGRKRPPWSRWLRPQGGRRRHRRDRGWPR